MNIIIFRINSRDGVVRLTCFSTTTIASSVRLGVTLVAGVYTCLPYAYVSASYTVALLCLLQYCQDGYDHQ